MDKLTKKDLFLVLLLIFVGLILRSVPLLLPYFNTDQSGIALQGWNIQQGELPLFYYGQTFQGTLEGYLAAFLFTLTGSSSPLVLGLLPLISSTLFLILFFLLTKNIFGKHVALLALIFAALGPTRLMQWGHDPRLHYSLVLVYQSLIFLLTLKLLYPSPSVKQRKLFFILGVVGGLAWWTNFLNVHTLLIAALFLFWKDPKLPLKREAYLGLGGFLIGSLPVWLFNFSHDFVTFKMKPFQSMSHLLHHLPDFFQGGFTSLLGFTKSFGVSGYSTVLWAGVILFYASLFYFLFFDRNSYRRGKGLLVGVLASVMLVTSGTAFARGILQGGDYLIALLPVCLVMLAVFIESFRVKLPLLYFALILFVVGNNMVQNYYGFHRNFSFFNESQANWIHNHNLSKRIIFETLRKKDLHHLYIQKENFKFNYLGNKNFIFSDFYEDNYPPYAEKVDAADKVGILAYEKFSQLEDSFQAMGVEYEKTALPGLTLYSHFKQKFSSFRLLPTELWRADASLNPDQANLAFDRFANTRWSTDKPKQKGMWFMLDLGRAEEINRVSINPDHWEDHPSGVSIELSKDKKRWTEVVRVNNAVGPFYWDGTHPFYRVRRARTDYVFKPAKGRYIRLKLLGQSKRYFWSIAEIYVYKPNRSTLPVDLMAESKEIQKILSQEKISFVAADHWLSAKIKISSKDKIKIYPSNLFTGINREIHPATNDQVPLFLNIETAIVVTQDKVLETEDLLETIGFRANKKTYPHYVLYTRFKGNNSPPLYWSGDHLVRLK